MRNFSGIDELEQATGEQLGYSDWYEITQEAVNLFADATGDHQWIHVDPERAASGPFGGTIAHGYMTLSLIPVLVSQVWSIDNVSMKINYGCNKVRFPAPVPVGSRVRAGVEVVGLSPNDTGAQLVTKVTIEVDGASRPACVAETVTVLVN